MNVLTHCIAATLAMTMAAWGCGNETPSDGEGGAGGTTNAPDGAMDVPDGAAPAPTGADGAAVNGDAGPDCPAQASRTMATHIVIDVRWPSSLAVAAGEGELHLWTKADLTTQGNAITGGARPCGIVIPALTKRVFLGGGKVQLEIPDSAWDAAKMPVFQVRGATAGFDVGSSISMEPLASLLGLELADPLNDPWPGEATKPITTVDHDADGRPGVTAVPRTDSPYGAPPLDLGGVLDPGGARADEVYLAMRTSLSLAGTRDSCVSARGTAQVSSVDSLVLGCHVRGGGVCTGEQAELVAGSQPRFTVESATFRMVQVPPEATCADVRAALPAR